MPALLTGTGTVFVGRTAELERLLQLWKEAAGGEPGLALLSGEPGVGKTRLAAEVAARAHAQEGIVLAGRCDEDLGVPYQPFVEALRHYIRAVPPADRRFGHHAGDLVRLLPEIGTLVPGLSEPLRSDPETERYRLFDGVVAWLAEASADAPVLVVLDDLQWATKPTLLLLRHITRSSDPRRLLLLGTYRDTELSRSHPLTELLADLRRQEGVERLPLTGLDSGGVVSFMEQAAGHELDDDGRSLAQAVWAETEGNPFFVGEVLHHLAESGGVTQQEGRWSATTSIAELGIPEGVREVVGRRLSRLSDRANEVLCAAAVIGAGFDLAVLGTVCTVEADALADALEEAVAARLVLPAPGPRAAYRFAHALVRATLYEELSPPDGPGCTAR